MSFLSVEPSDELKFPFELRKQVSATFTLFNKTTEFVVFKVKTTSPKKYCVRPNTGTIPPQTSTDVTVTMQAQKEPPPDMQSKDKFLVQSVVHPAKIAADAPHDLFSKEAGREVQDHKLRVVFTTPPTPITPIMEDGEGSNPDLPKQQEGGDEGGLLATQNAADVGLSGLPSQPSPLADVSAFQAKLKDTQNALLTTREEREAAAGEVEKLKRELVRVKQEQYSLQAKSGDGWSLFVVIIVALISFLIGLWWGRAKA